MNILVIGNGFDVAHGLPTKYTNFLKFVKTVKHFKEIGRGIAFGEHQRYVSYIKDLLDRAMYNSDAEDLYVEIMDLVDNNIWMDYFEKVNTKDGWIDLEREISKVIQMLAIIKNSVCIQGKEEMDILKICETDPIITAVFLINNGKLSFEKISEIEQRCIKNLNKLIRCLEIYLSDIVNNISVNNKLKEIAYLKCDKILSFNYTNTYERIYNKNKKNK